MTSGLDLAILSLLLYQAYKQDFYAAGIKIRILIYGKSPVLPIKIK
jgi:hypothetical protein